MTAQPMPNTTATATSFELSIPPEPEMLRVVRLAASGAASFADVGLSVVEGLRVGADELVSTLILAGAGTITVTFAAGPDSLSVTARTELAEGAPFEVDPLTDRMLTELVTTHSFEQEDGVVTGHIALALTAD